MENNKTLLDGQTNLEMPKNTTRDSMVWYRSFFDAVETIKDINTKYQCYYAILCYGFFGEEPKTDNEIVSVLFTSVKRNIDSNIRRYENCKKNGAKGAEYSKLGGAPKGNQNAKKNKRPQKQPQKQPQEQPLYDNDNDNDNVYDNENDNVNVYENENVYDMQNLSQISQKLHLNFPNKNLHIKQASEINKINLQKIDVDKLIKKIKDSEFLLTNNNLGLEWCIRNYYRIVAGEFDNYKQDKEQPPKTNSFSDQLERVEQSLKGVIDIE